MRFEDPPKEWDPSYMQRQIRLLNQMATLIRSKDVTFSRVRITDLPTSATGLSPGDLWNDGGDVKVA